MSTAIDPTLIELVSGGIRVGIVPGLGGSLAFFRRGNVDVLRPLAAAPTSPLDVLGTAMFPMLPWANRIPRNSLSFRGERLSFGPNVPGEPLHVHGTGWLRPWHLTSYDPASATIRLVVDGAGEPYHYCAEQTFSISTDRLTVGIGLTNIGNRARPFGMGLHPWFIPDAATTLQFTAERFHLEEPGHLAGDAIEIPQSLDFTNGAPAPTRWRNNDYSGWLGTAIVSQPLRNLTVRVTADPLFGHLMLFVDPKTSSLCLEPQSNATLSAGDSNDLESNSIILEPGETVSGSIEFAAKSHHGSG